MDNDEKDRIEVTVAEVAYLTLGRWLDIAIDCEITSCYCGVCDDVDAVLVVRDYYLSLSNQGVIANGICKSCGEELLCTYGTLEPQLIQDVLAMNMRSR